jgi:hypothetical protein
MWKYEAVGFRLLVERPYEGSAKLQPGAATVGTLDERRWLRTRATTVMGCRDGMRR